MAASSAILGVLISGRGSNLRAIAGAVGRREIAASIGVVISNREDAAGLSFARENNLVTAVMPHGAYSSRREYDLALIESLRGHGVTMVCLAGFMRLLGPDFCAAFPDAVLNIHPSLLPSFPGTHAQRQAIEHGVKVSGATVHLVTPALDAGPILMQAAVAVEDNDTEATLSERILAVEHRLYPKAIDALVTRPWRVSGRRVVFDGPAPRI